jgi:hypothetical protein
MKWFDQWFARKCRWAWENHDIADVPEQPMPSTKKARRLGQDIAEADWEDGLRINIKRVIGGSVVTFRTYDRRTDQSESRHYIITAEQDFNTELGKIITMESMRQSA